jgi:hypothetical protein
MTEQGFSLITDLFEAKTPGSHFINPRCFGEDFATWLREQLTARGIVASEPIQEDWGWVLLLRFRDRKFTLSIGIIDESISQTPAEWRVGVAYEKPLNGIRAWFRPVPLPDLNDLARILEAVLQSESRIQNLTRE